MESLMRETSPEPSPAERITVCCRGSLANFAYGLAFLCIVVSWCLFIFGWTWTSRHEVPLYHYSFIHVLPGIIIMTSFFCILWPPSTEEEIPSFVQDELALQRQHILTMCGWFWTITVAVAPLLVLAMITYWTWYPNRVSVTLTLCRYDPRMPIYYVPVTVAPGQNATTNPLSSDIGLRGIFSSSGSNTKTTTPPPTTSIPPPPLTLPPFSGSSIPAGMYVAHGLLLACAAGLCVLGNLWREQTRKRTQQLSF